MKRMRTSLAICLMSSMTVLALPIKSHAAGFALWTGFLSVWSAVGGVSAAGIGATTQVIGAYPTTGQVITVGGAVVLLVDPTFATFLDGQISLDFDANSLEVTDYGWLGDWGADPSLLAPPVTGGPFIPEGTSFTLQSPNSGLSTSVSVDNTNGNITAYYDWGAFGYQSPSDIKHFNFFSVVFQTKIDLNGISDFDSKVNFSATGNFNNCIPPGRDEVQLCGQPAPEPSSLISVLVFGAFGTGAVLKRRRESI